VILSKFSEISLEKSRISVKMDESIHNLFAVVIPILLDACSLFVVVIPVVVDDFSKFTVIYLLQDKSEIVENLKDYHRRIQQMFDRKLKTINSDNNCAFVSELIKKFCAESGTKFQQVDAITKIKEITEMARKFLVDSKLENKYWGEAVITSNYIQNRAAQSSKKSPFEICFSKKPDVDHLKQFGSHAYVRIPKSKDTQELIFVMDL
jgi:hypothetical protein